MEITSRQFQVIPYQVFLLIVLKTGIFCLVSFLILWNMYNAANSQFMEIKNFWVNQSPRRVIKMITELEILSYKE